MEKNLGALDKIIRLVIAAIVAVLYFSGTISGTLAIVLLIVSGIFVLTSLINFCPLYALFGLSSNGKKKTGTT